jgi:preprotein translocase subunit SecA
MAYVERSVLLQTLDHLWREHLVNLDHLRSVVGFRGYAQRDPLQGIQAGGFELFQAMLGNLRQMVTAQLMRVELVREAADAPPPQAPRCSAITSTDDRRGRFRRRVRMADDARAKTERVVAAEDRDPNNPTDLGQGRPQRGLPLRLGQEVQALPRRVRS